MDEFDLIKRYFAPLARDAPGAFGLMDDAASFSPPPGEDLVLTKDAMVAGVHFLADDPPFQIARKLLRVNLSDLAAKGARPAGYLLACAWPRGGDEAFIRGFAEGLAADQDEFGIRLWGGDTVATPGPLTLSLTAIGTVRRGAMVRRGGARPGDEIFVTGTIGDAGCGLRLSRGEGLGLDGDGEADREARAHLRERYLLPRPRCALGAALAGLAHGCLDISDGLIADLGHMAAASGVGIEIALGDIPLSAPARRALAAGRIDLAYAATAGDDYELAIACPPAAAERLAEVARAAATPLARIGRVLGAGAPPEVRVLGPDGGEIAVEKGGYSHQF